MLKFQKKIKEKKIGQKNKMLYQLIIL